MSLALSVLFASTILASFFTLQLLWTPIVPKSPSLQLASLAKPIHPIVPTSFSSILCNFSSSTVPLYVGSNFSLRLQMPDEAAGGHSGAGVAVLMALAVSAHIPFKSDAPFALTKVTKAAMPRFGVSCCIGEDRYCGTVEVKKHQLRCVWKEVDRADVLAALEASPNLRHAGVVLRERGKGICHVPISDEPVRPRYPAGPSTVRPPPRHEFAAVTQVRNVALQMREWLVYHFSVGFDHMYVYDDGSSDHLLSVLHPFMVEGLVTYRNWSSPRAGVSHGSRQFMAIQHWIDHYAHEVRFAFQMDDDCFQVVFRNATAHTLEPDIRPYYRALFSNKVVAQVQTTGLWFGPGNVTEQPPLTTLGFFWRLKAAGMVDWSPVLPSRTDPLQAYLPIARGASLVRSSGITHEYTTGGPGTMKRVPPTEATHFHYKVQSLAEHRRKVGQGSAWGSIVGNDDLWHRANTYQTQVHDTSMLSLHDQIIEWSALPTDELIARVKARQASPETLE